MSKDYLAVLVPLNEQEIWQSTHSRDNRDRARMSVWHTVTQFLLPYLGKEFSSFMPAACPWGSPLPIPFGVVLGAPEAGLLLHFYTMARKAQADAVVSHYERIEDEGSTVAQLKNADGLTIVIKSANMASLEEKPDIQWCARFMRGELTADTGLYYYGIGNTHIETTLEKRILSNLEQFALCAVELCR